MIAGDEHQRVVARRGQGGVETAQWAAIPHAIADQPEAGRRPGGRLFPDDEHDVVAQRGELRHLAVQDGPSAHNQGAFVASAEAGRVSAGEDCRAWHRASILSCGA